MKTVEVYGSSDDLIEFSGIQGCDEFLTSASYNNHYAGMFVIQTPDYGEPDGNMKDRLFIHVIYDGSWSFALSVDEEMNFPSHWVINRSWGVLNDYSEVLQIEVPDDAILVRLI